MPRGQGNAFTTQSGGSVTGGVRKRRGDGMAEFQAATVQIAGGNYADAARLLRAAEAQAAGSLRDQIASLRQQCEEKAQRMSAKSQRHRRQHYWIKSTLYPLGGWAVGYLDGDGNWWILGVAGWFSDLDIDEVGPAILPPDSD